MIGDYSKYEMKAKEKALFYGLGFMAFSCVIYLFYHSLFLSLIGGLIVLKARKYYEKLMAAKQIATLNTQFKDLLYSLSASVASGRQMSEALIEACENLSIMYSKEDLIMRELLHIKSSILRNNESDRVLLVDFARRSHSEDINNFVRVYATCRNLGGDLEQIISRTSEILTDKMNIQREIETITAQKKFEGRLIALMPLAMLLILNLLSPAYIAPLYSCFLGRLIMTASLGALLGSALLMERISRVEI